MYTFSHTMAALILRIIVFWKKVIIQKTNPGLLTRALAICNFMMNNFIKSRELTFCLSFIFDRFTHGQLIEINSHSLFSKWFSEVRDYTILFFGQLFTRFLEQIDFGYL